MATFLLFIVLVQPPLILPPPAGFGPPPSIFSKLPSPFTKEPPPILNLASRKSVTVFGNRFSRQVKELKVIALKSPLSFLRLQQNAVIIFSTLRGLSPTQVSNMTIFCQGKAVSILDEFANQIVLKLNKNYPDGTKCIVAAQFEEIKGSGDIKILNTELILPKFREI